MGPIGPVGPKGDPGAPLVASLLFLTGTTPPPAGYTLVGSWVLDPDNNRDGTKGDVPKERVTVRVYRKN